MSVPLLWRGIFFVCIFISYNRVMMKDCNKCGRSFSTGNKCNYCNSCFEEYKYTMPACIKNQAPSCMAKAVIPSITVQTVDGLTNLANCFVHVTDINTTFYVDDKHRPMITWAGDVEVDLPANVQTGDDWNAYINSFKLRSQHLLIRFKNNDTPPKWMIERFYFDKTGKIYWAGEYEEIDAGGLI